jgi:sporulation protein YlmC with PRC-barrel domain
MEIKRPLPAGATHTALAAAVALMIFSPAYGADPAPTMRHYDSAVPYADYSDPQGSYKLRASELIGRNIHNANDDEIGEIEDLIVSRDGDQVMAIISLGSFFDLGSKLVAIPYQELRVTNDGKNIYYNATKEDLERRNPFMYADSDKSARSGPVDNKPGANSEGKPADNSAHNADDVEGATLTPLDQSGTDADVAITRAIRKALVDDGTLGTNAQNVKVITIDGAVTLRGVVANADEQARIAAIAKSAAGPEHVQNELQVLKR